METHQNHVQEMLLVGGSPALDFVNTLGGLLSTGPVLPADEHIHSYDDLLTFGLRTGVLPERRARTLAREAGERPADAAAALERALRQRACIEDVFRAVSAGSRPGQDSLRTLIGAGAHALRQAELEPAGAGYGLSWDVATTDLEAPLWPLAHSAVELLTSPELERLRACKRCRWLFLDESKNRSRRWCSMEGCGTDEKKERYVERRRARRA